MYKVLVGKPEGKRPLGRPRRRWEDGIRMDLREIGLGGCGLDCTGSGHGPVAGCCECGDEPSGSCATEFVLISSYVRLRHTNERQFTISDQKILCAFLIYPMRATCPESRST
jgi:hypothetical protein